ncbi:MAG TPA: hypothetical protein VN698_03215, partial [Bacteroidia bacterium]|nr:hypothetical protein [Bacteroidia bacterium]
MKRKLLTSLLFIVFTCYLSFSVKAQIVYTFTATSGGSYTANGGTSIIAASTDDATSSSTAIGFSFKLGCTTYTTFQANSNGIMFLGTSLATSTADYTNNLNSGSDRPLIAPLWDDLGTSSTGNVNYKLTGSSPNRVLTVEWLNMQWQVGAGISVSFQVKLYETTNQIDFIYKSITPGNITSPSASIGLSGPTSGDFYSLTTSGSAPSATKGTETNTLSTSPATGQVYSWTPSCVSITTGAVSPTTFALGSCTATATGTVAFTSTGTFNAGNYYTAWLSDASGSFGT